MQGKLIVFEGTDGSGKATQSELLCQELTRRGIPYRKLTFPRYQEESSALVRLYLGGAFGQKPGDVNAYAAASFYSVDRYASYKQDWGSYYEQGGLLIADRYTTSNAVHQTSKLPPEQQRPFVDWLFDFEYQKLGLPAPDRVLYLDLPTELSEQMMRRREGPPIPTPTSMSRTRLISAPAGRAPPVWWTGAAGSASAATGTAGSAVFRTSIRRFWSVWRICCRKKGRNAAASRPGSAEPYGTCLFPCPSAGAAGVAAAAALVLCAAAAAEHQ